MESVRGRLPRLLEHCRYNGEKQEIISTYSDSDSAPSPILRVEFENFEIGPEVRALPIIANFVVLEQQIILVKTRSKSV